MYFPQEEFTSTVKKTVLRVLRGIKPCNRPKINFITIRRRQFSLTYSVIYGIGNSMLPITGGKVKNDQNYRQIGARGKAECIKNVIYGILYYRRRCPTIYFSALPGAVISFIWIKDVAFLRFS